MSYEDLLALIGSELPQLKGKLEKPTVVYVKALDKVYITFKSTVLVEETSFLRMEKLLREAFPSKPLALRVVSPALGGDFREHIGDYKQVLVDFLRRNYPASETWLGDIDWRCSGDLVTLTLPNQFALDYMGRQNIQPRLAQAIKDIFALDMRVELSVSGDQEKRIAELREMHRREAERAISLSEVKGRSAEDEEKKRPRTAKKDSAAPKDGDQPEAARNTAIPQMTDKSDGRPIMGRSIADSPVEMKELNTDSGTVVVQGDIFSVEAKELKGGETMLVTFAVTDYTSSVLCKSFMRYRRNSFRRSQDDQTEQPPITEEERKAVQERIARIKVGMNVKLRGECVFDTFAHELAITVRDLVPMKKIERVDNAPEKRVELHMHTNMSHMDGISPPEKLVERAIQWGHPAVAITDHGALQGFPAAFGAAAGKIKLIAGCEGYLIDSKPVVRNPEGGLRQPIVVLDFESTGLMTRRCRVIEIGAVRLVDGTIEDSLSLLVNPQEPIPEKVQKLTGITDSMVADKETAATAIPKLMEFIGSCPIAAHNADFDVSLLEAELKRLGLTWKGPVLDTLALARRLYPSMKSHKLGSVCKLLSVSLKNAHRAVHDATATAQCLARMITEAEARGCDSYEALNHIEGEAIGESWHIILLAKNPAGLVNLNRLVTISNLEYFRKRPHMPRSVIQAHREGLIIGSACESGELYQAVLEGEDWERIREIASFYDYLEIQPIQNNAFLVRDGKAKDEEELREINRKIVRLGEELGKPVCATGDVHFLEPHNAINRAIIQEGMGYSDCDLQPPLYFKTTEEMLEDFAYLGKSKAFEVVVANPQAIAAQVETFKLFPDEKKTYQPFWPDAENDIQTMTWRTAHELYGDPLPDIVKQRLDKELSSIVGYGYCTLYSIAQKLVSKSLEDGYLVGSRGSVGSSLVARMCGITEVNALPAHYRCIYCRKGFFDVDTNRYRVGFDLPDKDCPICGRRLTKDGFDIPFEVFLGFKGDKVPDIDLNFSGEEQNRAHHYVEELFGRDHVFRAGTIGTLAFKTAIGYVLKYAENHGWQIGNTEKSRLAEGLVGIKRTTGQHPGGMVVVPKENDINEFTAVQHPADDMDSDFTTTHFDFNSMHDKLVKLDCLGHDDPTMMHMLEELTGIHFQDVPLDDWDVRSLFHKPDALGVTTEDILCNTGTYGVPEFGTGFVRNMLDETHPSTMEELLRISGLSHGTDVWTGNAQQIIADGLATLSDCVCCRDDIMNYLIKMGVEPKMAFTTMEDVRKGKGLKPEMVEAMESHHVPEWYIESCRKIKYMFPKGHAVAYVTMALRVAWFKLHYPSAYYATFLTVRAKGFDAATMLLDPHTCRQRIRELRSMDKATAKDKEDQTALELVLEMNMRGIRLLPVDLYRSDVRRFTIENGDLRCPLTSLGGLGESSALPIVEARRQGPFISVEDLRSRARLGQGVIDMLRANGALEGLAESNQISMF
ncbi:MAG: PolC-type DNA polymerase III [Clostridia bacterium]|nr:PolC-type DNA polymerase III [Clostridia bacterium]